MVYISFSGGKDSTVLLDLVRDIYPGVPAAFIDTGLEYPEIRGFVKTIKNVTTLRTEMTFFEVLKKYGYPVISKDIAKVLYYAKKRKTWALKRLEGLEKNGVESEFKQRYKKYKYLLNADFNISNVCCLIMKERPARRYERETGRKAYLGMMASEGQDRKSAYLKTGCNTYKSKIQSSKPLGFWTEQDILQYIKQKGLKYASVYGDIVEDAKGKLTTTKTKRTGCMFCAFGAQCEKGETRFQRMSRTHPKLYNYCIEGGCFKSGIWTPDKNGLGMGKVLDYIGVEYKVKQESLF